MKLNPRDVVKFGILVGLTGIFLDAAIVHSIWWENGPYWDYWLTEALLLVFVFTAGTSFFGMGVWQALLLSAVQTAILEIYYRGLWVGVASHFLAIFSGYLFAMWAWNRSKIRKLDESFQNAKRYSALAVITSLISVVMAYFITYAFLFNHFTAFPFLLLLLAMSFIFFLFWRVYVGFDSEGMLTAALILSLILSTASIYHLDDSTAWIALFLGNFSSILLGLIITKFLVIKMQTKQIAPFAIIVILGISSLLPIYVNGQDFQEADINAQLLNFQNEENANNWIGWIILIGLTLLFWWMAVKPPHKREYNNLRNITKI